MTLFYFAALLKKKIAMVDTAWGVGIALGSLYSYFLKQDSTSILPIILIMIWGTRLASYMAIRSHGAPDDKRYLEMAKTWTGSYPLNLYFRIFFLQGVLQCVMCLFYFYRAPEFLNYHNPIVLIGLFIAIFGLSYETIADYTLYQFKKKQKGLCNIGVWKYSRHPNYFGEMIFWWGLYLAHYPTLVHWQIISPIFLTSTILKVSGPPLIEKHYDREKNPNYFNKNSIIPDWRVLFKKS